MSDEEDIRADDAGETEAQLAMQKRRQVTTSSSGLDEESKEMLEANKDERSRMEEEIQELRERSERRKRERAEEEKLLAERRRDEERARKSEEEERKKKKEDEEKSKRDARMAKMAEFEKWKNPTQPNFVISKKDRPVTSTEDDEEEDPEKEKKSKEQLEAEKRAILAQRITKLEISGFDAAKLSEKAKELHNQLYRLESEKYDLEKRFKCQQYDMMELAERARQMNKVGKQGNLKRILLQEDESDKIQERFAGCPSRIIMYSEYERQKDKREFGGRRDLYTGPIYGCQAERIQACRQVIWNEEGLPLYNEEPPAEGAPAQQQQPEEVAAE